MKSKKLDTTVGGYMQDWDSCIKDNNSKLHHPANFEERFVREILAHVPEITPQDIVAQYHFQELDGCNRYVDFCIRNDKKGYFVLIELDGKWKQQRLEELLERQNTLIASTQGKLLRFANSTWLNKAPIVIQTISNTLNEQNKHFNEKTRTEALEHKIKEQQESVEELSKQIQIHKANEQKELGESTSNPF
ncbi:MAG: hypothetical protein KDI00_06280, partial [Pseudomonadales bacterium]|nr:hypothetical protein [Pseudomonadales bacterium]